MQKKLYDLMDWAKIEAVTYTEEPHPKSTLGAVSHGSNTLIQLFVPGAESVSVHVDGAKSAQKCEMADEAGFFACLVKRKLPFKYKVEAVTDKGKDSFYDPYQFPVITTKRRISKFLSGSDNKAYELFGAHTHEIDGVKGMRFTVYAPKAMRVSVVCDSNSWNGSMHQMENLYDTGVFELFIPGIEPGELYKYEIKTRDGRLLMKTDPYAHEYELSGEGAGKASESDGFKWTDEKYLKSLKGRDRSSLAYTIYEAQCAAFREEGKDGYKYRNYKKIAEELYSHIKSMGYQALELLPVAEYINEASLGFNSFGFFAPTSRFGTQDDLKYLVNYMHEKGIEVILELSISSYPKAENGLYLFDGGALYEHADSRRADRTDGNVNFDLSKPEVRSFLMSSIFYWTEQYHLDGIKLNDLSSMLYHDFGKQNSAWLPNIYGGSENLEAALFLRELTGSFHKKYPGRLLMAADSSSYGEITGDTYDSDHALGFDYCWNMVFSDNLSSYMSYDPLYRTHHYDELIFPPVIAGSEKFIIGFSYWDVSGDKGGLISTMSGNQDEKEANLKMLLALQYAYPGKKLIFMGQDCGKAQGFGEDYIYKAADGDTEKMLEGYVRDLIKLYNSHPALHEDSMDMEQSFEWINCISPKENIIVFARHSKDKEETLLFVFNFENIPRKNYRIGVPFAGKYKEIFNSDAEEYGGFDFRTLKVRKSEEVDFDGRKNSLLIKVPPLAVSVYKLEDKA
ncbi:MAG: 1,4-alpha-glucan branching enzyme [Lachnospiraceae bacterium]|nr:1,4-alpha-glucan branching enzyme [Lachnospiraceae bacterium]